MKNWRLLLLVVVICVLLFGCGTSMSSAKSKVGKTTRVWNPVENATSLREITIFPKDGSKVTTMIGFGDVLAPPGANVLVKTIGSRKTGASGEEYIETASAIGPSIRGQDLDKISLEAPNASLPGGIGASAGGGFIDLVANKVTGLRILYVIGGLLVVVGVFCGFVLNKALMGIGIACSGIGLCAVAYLFEVYPWVVLLAAVIILALLVWFIISAISSQTRDKALLAIVRGVQLAPGSAEVKKRIALESGSDRNKIDPVIRKIKANEHLKNLIISTKPSNLDLGSS